METNLQDNYKVIPLKKVNKISKYLMVMIAEVFIIYL